MSLRIRLALGLALLGATVLVLVSVATFQLLRTALLNDIERDVVRRSAALAESERPLPDDLDVFSAPDVFVQVLDGSGRPVASSGNLGSRVLPRPAQAMRGEAVEVHVDDRPLFLAAAPLPGGDTAVVARSPVSVYGALGQLRQLLYIVNIVALGAIVILAWLAAHLALRPVSRVAAAAEQVRIARDLSQRVPQLRRSDEIGRLATTFNAMLAELEDTYQELDESNQRLRRFMADCAHELRAPLTLAMSTLDLLARLGDSDPDFKAKALGDLRIETHRMARMITQLLILARADSGVVLSREQVSLREIVDDAVSHELPMSDEIRVVGGHHDVLDDAAICGDADYLRQALLILLDNAVKYTRVGGEVRVESAVVDGEARISVVDTGVGIESDDLPHIFERFYRGRRTNDTTGTGLGLAIAAWVAEQHGGRIEVASEPGRGSAFTLAIPLTALSRDI